MPYYEILCLAQGRLARRELGDLATRAAKSFMSLGGVVTRMHTLGSTGHGARKLAYTIRRAQVSHATGFYFSICAFASPAALREVLRRLRLDERVLRVLPARRDATDAALPPPDAARALPGSAVGAGDATHALREFLAEYERRFPDGQTVVAAEEDREVRARREAGSDAAVQAVVDNLHATACATRAIDDARGTSPFPSGGSARSVKADQGLRWLLDLEEKKSS